MSDKIKPSDLFEKVPPCVEKHLSCVEYPWEIIPKIKDIIASFDLGGYTEITDGVYVGKNVKISNLATVVPPAVIGDNTEIRPGAYLRGNVIIGKGCVIGNSTEIKNSILFDGVSAPHYNYIGDSIVGNFAHLGAGVILSNLKSDKSNIAVKGVKTYPTCLRKMGSIIGDSAEIGCGCVLNPGTIIGKSTSVYPLNSVRGIIPELSIVKSSTVTVKKQTLGR